MPRCNLAECIDELNRITTVEINRSGSLSNAVTFPLRKPLQPVLVYQPMAVTDTAKSAVTECPFAEGDRVQERYGWPQHGRDGDSAVKRLGTVAAITRRPPNGRGKFGWQISVRWDGNSYVERGYTGATLIRVCMPPPIMMLLGSATDKGDHQS